MNNYQSPSLELLSLDIEKGFATSSWDETLTPVDYFYYNQFE